MRSFKAEFFAAYRFTRKVNFLASKEIANSNSSALAWIHKIDFDAQKKESSQAYFSRSLAQISAHMAGATKNAEGDYALIHLSTTSERLREGYDNLYDTYGGHIVLGAAQFRNGLLNIIEKGSISKGFDPKAKVIKKETDANISNSDGSVKTLKGQEYQRVASFDNINRIKKLIMGHFVTPTPLKFGSTQYIIVLPLAAMGLSLDQVIKYMENYKNDLDHGKVYDRMNDACTHAVIASLGMKPDIRGLTTQRAAMKILSLTKPHDKELYYGLQDAAKSLGLSFTPAEVYNRRIQQQDFANRPDAPKANRP